MTDTGKAPKRRDVFTAFPATTHDRLIVRYPDGNDGRLAFSFAESANRLAGTFAGEAPDDALLLPFLYLYRHAIELELKHSIKYAARLRRNGGDVDPDLDNDKLAAHLKQKLGHKLLPLVDELDKHLVALKQPRMPSSVRSTLNLISSADRLGESFRYEGSLPDEQDYIDFLALAQAVADAYQVTAAAADLLSVVEDNQRDWFAEKDEFEQEMRADMEAEYAAEFEQYD